MPYAINGAVSQALIEGGVEISEAQYNDAVNGMMAGQVVTIDNGFAVIDKPAPEPAPEPETPEPTQEEKARARMNALQTYLDETDWMVIRHAETGEAVPDDVLTDRQAARDEISELRAIL